MDDSDELELEELLLSVWLFMLLIDTEFERLLEFESDSMLC